MKRTMPLVGFAAMLLLFGAGYSPAAASSGSGKAEGFIYGTVETEGGHRYTGIIRWGDEEAFWDDLFNSDKTKLPYIDRQPEDQRKRRDVHVLGFHIGYDWDEGCCRQFVARFGDIAEIRPEGGEKVDVRMKTGTTYHLDDGSNDIGAELQIEDPELGAVNIEWKRIERITFAAAPGSARPEDTRLYGEVATEDGVFRGFVQWDSQECLGTDKLDGYSEDGKLSLAMGRIRSIEKKGRSSSGVEMRDGRKFELHGTNDVDSSIRGIFVEDERYGRVKVSWDAFRRVDFNEGSATGRGYADYKPAKELHAKVTDKDGKTWKGRIIFDLDESESWEMLDGKHRGVEYSIPFEMVRSIERVDDDSSAVTLKTGRDLKLEETQDVTERNAGVLVLQEGSASEHYVAWDRVDKIEFD